MTADVIYPLLTSKCRTTKTDTTKEVHPMPLETLSLENQPLESPSTKSISLRQFFLDKLDREAVLVRKALDRIPEDLNDFKPHERSMELGYLAALVAGILG